MQISDIKPKESGDAKKRTLEWTKIIHVVATLILQKNQQERRDLQKPSSRCDWGHSGTAAEACRCLLEVAEFMGISADKINEVVKDLK